MRVDDVRAQLPQQARDPPQCEEVCQRCDAPLHGHDVHADAARTKPFEVTEKIRIAPQRNDHVDAERSRVEPQYQVAQMPPRAAGRGFEDVYEVQHGTGQRSAVGDQKADGEW